MEKNKLVKELSVLLINNFGRNNFDHVRYKSEMWRYKTRLKDSAFNLIKYLLGLNYKTAQNKINEIPSDFLSNFFNNLKFLDLQSKTIYTNLLKFRILGYRYVKINSFARKSLEDYENIDNLIPKICSENYEYYSLHNLGHDIKIIYPASKEFLLHTFKYGQYSLKNISEHKLISIGDCILDVGACYGDSSLLFSRLVGEHGSVYAFEMSNSNIKVLEKNIQLNECTNIKIVKNAVSSKSGDKIQFCESGPGSKVLSKNTEDIKHIAVVNTITIDDFVKTNSLSRVDLIKMDIEGAETDAITGALKTIELYRPALAIAIYHGDDFYNLPSYLCKILTDYIFHIGHYTINAEETILYCLPKEKSL